MKISEFVLEPTISMPDERCKNVSLSEMILRSAVNSEPQF